MEYWPMADYPPLIEKQHNEFLTFPLLWSDNCPFLHGQHAYLPISSPFKVEAQNSHCPKPVVTLIKMVVREKGNKSVCYKKSSGII